MTTKMQGPWSTFESGGGGRLGFGMDLRGVRGEGRGLEESSVHLRIHVGGATNAQPLPSRSL